MEGHYDEVNEGESFNEEKMKPGASAWEALTSLEQYVTCVSEKAPSLETLLIQVKHVASDYAAQSFEDEEISDESVGKAFEFDIFSSILNSEVKELDDLVDSLQVSVVDMQEQLLETVHAEGLPADVEEKLRDAEQSLKKTQDVITDIRLLSAKFESDLAFAGLGTRSVAEVELGITPHSKTGAKQKEATEQQTYFLQLLEKSLARELDLEKKLAESRHNKDELKLLQHYTEQVTCSLEESMELVLQRMFEAENAAETFLGISKELVGRLQIVQFNLKGSLLRESGLKANLQRAEDDSSSAISETLSLKDKIRALEEQLRECDTQLQTAKASAEASCEQQNILRVELSNIETVVTSLKEDVGKLESRAKVAEEKCMQLSKTNIELNEQVDLLRSSGTEKANVLERKLKESDTQLEHAKASVEAIEEQQNMLYSALSDMENLIEDLKGKVLKAESRAESAESKCNLLSETNLELNEELGFLRSRLECMEASLNQAEDTRLATAKDIGIKTKFIADLVIKLAMERERLQLQVSALTKQNKFLVKKSLKMKDLIPNDTSNKETDTESNSSLLKATEEELTDTASANIQVDKSTAAMPSSETRVETASTTKECSSGAGQDLETVRTIEATQLNFTYILMAVLILLASISAIYLFQLE